MSSEALLSGVFVPLVLGTSNLSKAASFIIPVGSERMSALEI